MCSFCAYGSIMDDWHEAFKMASFDQVSQTSLIFVYVHTTLLPQSLDIYTAEPRVRFQVISSEIGVG